MTIQFSKGRNDNTIFVTERCSNNCIMCCQPPSEKDDGMALYAQNSTLIQNAQPDTDYVCITGGEPTMYKDLLFSYIDQIAATMPEATIHLLTNGRRFSDIDFLGEFNKHAKGRSMVIGIPLHADNYLDHDSIAGSKGAFIETIKGLQNLGILGYEIELRLIILKQNYGRFTQIAEFIGRNLPFVNQVSIMGLEIIGKAEKNYSSIWIEPSKISDTLKDTVKSLEQSGNNPKIFNIPLCLLPKSIWQYSCQSISHWKRTLLQQCNSCILKNNCCGVFSTSKFYSSEITPIQI